jgi:proliferating cell nuclear antigen PCNA
MHKYKFHCKTHDAYILKNLIELLQNNVKTGCFEISKEGIRLRMMDANRRLLFDVNLQAIKFHTFIFHHNLDILYVGVNMNHLNKLLRSIKKKDSVHIFIDEQDTTNLGLEIIPKDKSPPVTTSFIKIQNIQNLEIMLPSGYENHLLIPSSGFSKMCKDMITISNVMMVNMHNHHVRFSCNVDNIYSREIRIGETDIDDNENSVVYMEEFDSEIFSRITKMSGLHPNMYLYYSSDLPLMLKSNIGNIGELAIFIKTRKQILLENNTVDNVLNNSI